MVAICLKLKGKLGFGFYLHACPTAASLDDLKRQELVFCEHVSLMARRGAPRRATVALEAGG
jgi:hypothetical protein